MESLTLLATHPHGREQTTAALVATGLLTGLLVVVVVPLLLAPTGVLVSAAMVVQVILGQLTASLMGAAAEVTLQQQPVLGVLAAAVRAP
jgi:predicted ABC-type exoprotein transport system permease subunit